MTFNVELGRPAPSRKFGSDRIRKNDQKRDACKIESQTPRILLLFLYGTGALTGEALRLRREDVDLKSDLVTIRGNRFNRVRRIPIGPDLHRRLRQYVDSASQRKNQGKNFFANRDGSAIKARILGKSFERLRRLAGIARHDEARYQPRLHDLRATFAVHRLTAWFKQGADLNRMLPALSAYLGQVGLGSTERYLSASFSPILPRRNAASSIWQLVVGRMGSLVRDAGMEEPMSW